MAFWRKFRKLIRNPQQFFIDRRKKLNAKNEVALKNIHRINPGYELFDLVGENWSENNTKPVAILWNFNPWKREFVCRYLPEYRLAFARGKTSWNRQKKLLDQHTNLTFIIWGMPDRPELDAYAVTNNIPVYRMEDGFIRSATLGSQHTLPLSLVLDKDGIYFNAHQPSQLENILNTYDFQQNSQLILYSAMLRNLLCGLKISKYNLDSLRSPAKILGPKIKRRVLVIGQVEGDASIRYGLVQGWTNHQLIELAVSENPGAEIIYKPHPDVVKGFRTNSDTHDELAKLCRILEDTVVMADLFQHVDHVYTLTSLSGCEAMMHGLPVTVIGAPFYAGWGLTDDRTPIHRRKRKLTLDELFCGVYLLYPRYLTDLKDPMLGCLAAMLRVAADRKQQSSSLITKDILDKKPDWVAHSNYWPVLFKPDTLPALRKRYGKKIDELIPISEIFACCKGDLYQRTLMNLIAGQLGDPTIFPRIVRKFRNCVKLKLFSHFLAELWSISPSDTVLLHWAWLTEREGNITQARKAIEYLIDNSDAHKSAPGGKLVPRQKFGHVLEFARFELRQKNFDKAHSLFDLLLLSGHLSGELLAGLAEIAKQKFDFASASQILNLMNYYVPKWGAGRGHILESQSQILVRNSVASLESMAVACKFNTKFIESVSSITDALDRDIGKLPYTEAMLAACEIDDIGGLIGRAKALIANDRPADAENWLLKFTPSESERLRYCLTLSLAYSCQEKLQEAKNIIVDLLQSKPILLVYREGLRLAILMNDYAWGKKLLADSIAREIDVGDLYHRKIALGVGDIKGSYLSFRNFHIHKILKAYFGEKYAMSLEYLQNKPTKTCVILAFFGPGDEIRFASLYREMVELCGSSKTVFTCDPRLLNLLQNHYTDLLFVPSRRIRNLSSTTDYSNYNKLPGADLHLAMDNNGWITASNADRIILNISALGDVIENYSSFKGTPYLKAAPQLFFRWQQRLSSFADKPLVGLSWRSSLTTYSRNEHYLTVDKLAPLFDVPNVRFVNLQYDECTEELAWLENQFPGRIIHFPDLDQFNDLDGVAALMANLPLIIAPATTVAELAGALGRPTLFMSNSSELHWRKLPGTNIDVWHHSLTHVEGEILGDKDSLVKALVAELSCRFSN